MAIGRTDLKQTSNYYEDGTSVWHSMKYNLTPVRGIFARKSTAESGSDHCQVGGGEGNMSSNNTGQEFTAKEGKICCDKLVETIYHFHRVSSQSKTLRNAGLARRLRKTATSLPGSVPGTLHS